MINAIIGNNLKNLREDRRMTQESIALKADICLTSYRDLERGRTAIINKHIPKIAEILEASVEELLLGYKPDEANPHLLEDITNEYGGQISILETRIADLERLVQSHEETIRSKNEIIEMLKKSLDEDK